MKSIKEYLSDYGFDINNIGDTVEMDDMVKYMKEYAEIVRDKQIEYSAVGGARYMCIIRGTSDQLQNDFDGLMKAIKVKIDN